MHALPGTRKMVAALAVAAGLAWLAPATAHAWPVVRTSSVHLLFYSVGEYSPNRTQDGISSRGEFGLDPTGSGTTQGGYWPRGTVDNYIYNAGMEAAGVVGGSKPANPWGGDTIMVKCFDPIGTQRHCEEVQPVYISSNPDDAANWPEAALVPQGDTTEALFDPLLRGKVAASQGDASWIVWDGDPLLIAGRQHPLGLLAEYRAMGWNYPSGNEDIIYITLVFHNITSTNAADYTADRPAIQAIALQKAADFQSLNNAHFGVTLPAGGYTIDPLYAAWASDEDVGNPNNNYTSVNLPFAMFYAYEAPFSKTGQGGAVFDPAIFGPPFFPGFGFIGFKYLSGPTGVGQIQLFTATTNGGSLPDPNNSQRLFRIFAGQPTTADGSCNIAGDPTETHVCFVSSDHGRDIRSYASSAPLSLAPGEFKSIVVAAIYAAPVAIPGFTPTSTTDVKPGNPVWTESADSMSVYNGLNEIDSLTGFLQYTGGLTNPDESKHIPVQGDFRSVKGSLLDKALVAQNVFDHHFLLPFAPDPPSFFLIPGEGQVTILWKPSPSEATGDAFFAVASSATTTNPDGSTSPNALYDPNYRKFDVEGYRIYRGRTDNPTTMTLLKQFDYAGTVLSDYAGIVQNPDYPNCAPELGPQYTGSACPANFSKITPGVQSTVHVDYDLDESNGPIVQVLPGGRTTLSSGDVIVIPSGSSPDTLITGGNSGKQALSNSGVPFVFTDKEGACSKCGVADNVQYFYAVTAFDVNSLVSGPASLESAPVTKSVVVAAPAGNYNNAGTLTVTVNGRNGALTDKTAPTIDKTTGEFDKKALPADGLSLSLGSFATQVLKGTGSATMTYDSTVLSGELVFNDYFTVTAGSSSSTIAVPFNVGAFDAASSVYSQSGSFTAINIDPSQAAVYGGGSGYTLAGAYSVHRIVPHAVTNQLRACLFGGVAGPNDGNCLFQGPRWFSGANEDTPDPTVATPLNGATGSTSIPAEGISNAGSLPGVVGIVHEDAYGWYSGTQWRDKQYVMEPFVTAADYDLYWGSGGKIDSVIDITHDEPVPFDPRAVNSWGVLNSTSVAGAGSEDQRGDVLTTEDFTCVTPIRDYTGTGCSQPAVPLSNTAVPGQIAITLGSQTASRTAPVEPNAGFALYIKGRIFLFELQGGALPSSGTMWTMRDFAGTIYGGHNAAVGDLGPYAFYPAPYRPFNAPGAAVKLTYNVSNELAAVDEASLAAVHTVPDPYYVRSAYDISGISKVINFVNVPVGATIRIYSSSGVLVRVLTNTSTTNSGIVPWDVRNRSNQFVASGVFFYNVEGNGHNVTKRMTIVDFATNAQ
jgi:hypothetical protein